MLGGLGWITNMIGQKLSRRQKAYAGNWVGTIIILIMWRYFGGPWWLAGILILGIWWKYLARAVGKEIAKGMKEEESEAED